MSAPTTNIEKQKSRHRTPLLGIAAVLAFALALFAAFTVLMADDEDDVVAPATIDSN